jgi:hypothetical protein
LHTLLLQGFQQMLAALEQVATQEHNPRERLLQIASTYWDFVWHHPTLYQLMFDLKGNMHEVEEAKAAFLLVRAAIEDWNQTHGVTLTMAQLVYGGSNRARHLLSQAVNDLLIAWKMQSTS